MKAGNTFNLAMFVVLAGAALVCPTSVVAESTTICQVHKEPCAAGNIPSTVHMVAKNPLLQMTILGITVNTVCETSLAKGAVFVLEDPQEVIVQELTWLGCKRESNGAKCVVTTQNLGEVAVAKSALNLGVAIVIGISIKQECEGLPTCTFGGTPAITLEGAGHTAGAGNGMFTATKATVTSNGVGFCPKTASWWALYEPLEKLSLVS